jgi:ABC-type branched-subunit amino acid transport system substrate-binding protein
MLARFFKGGINRRHFMVSTSALAGAGAIGGSLPSKAWAADGVIKIGFLAPLTGPVAAWGKPGLDGCQIWAETVNAAGAVKLGDGQYTTEFVGYDNEYDPAKARTGVEWLAENKPELKTAVMCAQDDALGLPSVATYLAAFEAAGIEMLEEPLLFDPATTDFAPVVTKLIADNPDIVCLDTCYSDYVHPICEQLFQQGYGGQIISCTADFYDQMIAKTSKEFMEGFIFQFPDFDDPALNDASISFRDPNGFFATYNERHPGEWAPPSRTPSSRP